MAGRLALSVSQLNEYVRRLLQQDPLLREIELKGEISNLKYHQTGTLFFTLKDEQAAVSCVMYPAEAQLLQTEPFEGMRAVVVGSVGLYARGGQYQFYAREVRAQGVGVLYERYLALKERLEREGLFAQDKKRPIPGFVDTIGVVSSPTGAVIHDIMSVSLRRDEEARILLCPVRVQGAEAADEVVAAIRLLEQLSDVSVIVLARGGGSIEDLWTFNEERVVRAVAACRKPVVSAIGHETDFTLCDFAADLRAPTPSAAAECVTPLRSERIARLAMLRGALRQCALTALDNREDALCFSKAQLTAVRPERTLEASANRLHDLTLRLVGAVSSRLSTCWQEIESKKRELALLDPYRVLSRGYAIVQHEGGVVTSAGDVEPGERLRIVLHDGEVKAAVCDDSRQTLDSEEENR